MAVSEIWVPLATLNSYGLKFLPTPSVESEIWSYEMFATQMSWNFIMIQKLLHKFPTSFLRFRRFGILIVLPSGSDYASEFFVESLLISKP